MSSPGGLASSPETRGAKEVFHRLVRTMSGRSITSNEAASSVAVAQASSAEFSPVLQKTESSESLTSQSRGKRRLSIGDKLKKLAKDIPLGNIKKSATKGVLASPKVTSTNLLPEPSAGIVTSGHPKILSMVVETTEMDASSSTGPSDASPHPANDNPSPGTLARRLQDLIDALPFPDYNNQPIKNPKPPAKDKKGRPIVPPGASPIKDSKLIALLQSATFMNGGKAGQPRKSIWDVLEHIGVPPHGFPETDEPKERAPDDDGNTRDEPEQDTPEIFTDNSSIMVYSPLIPGLDDYVELAELVPVGVEEEFIDESSSLTTTAWTSMWPLSIISGSKPAEAQSLPSNVDTFHSHMSGDVVYSPAVTTIDELGRRVRVKTVRAWVPSTTKLSFQAMWWGYRLWLPPPVLAILSDKTIEATKRAAMITTALTWFFNHLPIDVLPLPVRPAALLMQRIVPYLGYIGTFISWSWGTIKSYDIGYGVTLTATWLLPIALIPGTWFERDFPKSPPESPPTNLPDSQAPAPPTPPDSPPTPLPSSPAPTTPSQPPTAPTSPAPTSPPTTPAPTQPSTGPPTEPPTLPPAPSTPSTELPPISSPDTPPTQDRPLQTPSDPSPAPTPSGPSGATEGFKRHPPSSPLSSPKALAQKLFFYGTTNRIASIPVPFEPVEPQPVPPTPSFAASQTPGSPPPVVVGSPLGQELLHGPVLGTVPLPDEEEEDVPVPDTEATEPKDTKPAPWTFLARFGF